jgi:hypothetical protein
VPFLARFRLGDGRLDPELRTALEAEGLLLAEEGLSARVRYHNFKAPGKRFHGKVTVEKVAVALSEERFTVYCRSGTVKLVDSLYTNPLLDKVTISTPEPGKLTIVVDYDADDEETVSGRITIDVHTQRAEEIAEQINSRLRR